MSLCAIIGFVVTTQKEIGVFGLWSTLKRVLSTATSTTESPNQMHVTLQSKRYR